MDIYVLNEQFESVKVIDDYISLTWTERYMKPGDFSLEVHAKDLIKYNLRPGYFLWKRDSDTLMCIEYVRLQTDSVEGNSILVKGRSLESYLDRRILTGKVIFEDVPVSSAVTQIFNDNVISPTDEYRKAPLTMENFPEDASTDLFSGSYQGETIADVLSEICETFGYGYWLRYINETYHFRLYKGIDRSWDQDENPWVVYSPKLDTLLTSEFVFDDSERANSFVICGEEQCQTINPTNGVVFDWPQMWISTDENHTGWDRREAFIDGSGISRWQGDYTFGYGNLGDPRPAEYVTHGWKKLGDITYKRLLLLKTEEVRKEAKNSTLKFEASGDHNIQWNLGEDMLLGDIVQMINEYGIGAKCRITEIIFSHDRNGLKIYPTFKALDDTIGTGGITWPLPSASTTRSTMIGCTTRPNL